MKKIITKILHLFIILFFGRVYLAKYLGVKIGNNCRIYINDFGSEPFLVEIGNNVTITSGVKILTHDGSTWLLNDNNGRRYLYKRVKIGNNVFVGVNSIIMPGVVVEDNVIIGAGSVVTKSVPEGKIIGGNPAKIIGSFAEYKQDGIINLISEFEIDKKLPYKQRILEITDITTKDKLK